MKDMRNDEEKQHIPVMNVNGRTLKSRLTVANNI